MKKPLVIVMAAALFIAGFSALQAGQHRPKLADYPTLVQFSSDAAARIYSRQHKLELVKAAPGYYKTKAAKNRLPHDPSIVRIENNYRYKAVAVPNDTLYAQQYAPPKMSAPAGWDLSTGGASTVIAVIDTGFALSHEDLAGKWQTNSGETGATTLEGPAPNCTSRGLALDKSCNNLDDDSNGYVDDWRGWDFIGNDNDVMAGTTSPTSQYVAHGTMTASLAAAATNNGKGIAGACWQCPILPVQVLGDNGVGDSVSVANGIRFAADHGASVISLSLGADGSDLTLQDAVNYALGKNITVVAAAGNSGPGNMIYPALYPGVISVGATDSNDNLASFSSTGPQLSVTAPGVNVRAAYWQTSNQTTAYAYASGTSMSTPEAAGLAGLLKSANPSAGYGDITRWIQNGADKVAGMGGANRTDQYGYGRINFYASLRNYSSGYSSQSAYPVISQASPGNGFIQYVNKGNVSWYDDTSLGTAPVGTQPVHLATSRNINRSSLFGAGWGGDRNRPAGNFAAVYESDGVTLAANQHVAAPGQIAKFSFSVSANTNIPPGTYREYFQPIVEGGSTMNDPWTFLDVTVKASSYTAVYDSQSAYPVPDPGQQVTGYIRYKNSGNVSWYDDTSLGTAPVGTQPVHLATSRNINRSSLFGAGWGGDRNRPAGNFAAVYESDGVTLAANQHVAAPGQIARFNIVFTSPVSLSAGTYREYFQPIVEGGSTMNDPGTFLDVTTFAATAQSQYYSQSAYPSIAPGSSASVFISYKNTGSVWWYDNTAIGSAPPSNLPVHLATSHPINRRSAFGDAWNPDANRPSSILAAVYEADGITLASNQHAVRPGQIGKFSFTLAAGSTAPSGTYREYFQPIVEGGSTMNDPGTFLDVMVP